MYEISLAIIGSVLPTLGIMLFVFLFLFSIRYRASWWDYPDGHFRLPKTNIKSFHDQLKETVKQKRKKIFYGRLPS